MSSNIEIKKKCEWCGNDFIARKTTTAYCSHRCANLAYKDRVRKERITAYQKELSIKEYNEPLKDLEQREFFNPIEAAKLMGISRATMYRYLAEETIKAVQFKGKTLIRRKDIDILFESTTTYNKRLPKEKAPITEFYTTAEVKEKYKMKADFLAYFAKMMRTKDQKWKVVYAHFSNFVQGKCTFGEVNVDLCKRFRAYLLNAKQLKHTEHKVSLNSAAGYYSTFRGLLKIAYRDKLLRENINDFLEKIEYEDVKKEYLTLDEVKRLAATPCDIPALKAASLFSCLTGLRISDIMNLQWSDFGIAPDQGYCIRIRTQKTKTEATLPISHEAFELCGEVGTGKVFKGLSRSMINYPLKNWLKKAKILKHITFHCFRHSYATLQIAAGTDIYTVSKMLTHRNVSTTQIYAELVSEKKRESANKISLK